MVDRFQHLRWIERSRTRIAEYGLFDVYTSRRGSSSHHDSEFLILDAPNWVTVVPYLDDRDAFLMVRQFRHGSSTITLEFPAGVVGRRESPEAAAARELREETGCVAAKLIHAGVVNPNPAFMTNEVHTFVATGLQCGAELDLDENELIDVEIMSVQEVVREIGRPPYTNGIMVTSLYWFQRWLAGRRDEEC